MASEGGSDPSEDVAKLFAVTESLVGAGIAPSIHQGRGIVVSALSKNTVRATIETSDDEEGFSFEIVKEELWRAVKLLEGLLDYGLTTSRVAAYMQPGPKEHVNYPRAYSPD